MTLASVQLHEHIDSTATVQHLLNGVGHEGVLKHALDHYFLYGKFPDEHQKLH